MLRTIDLRGEELTTSRLRRVLPRGGTDVSSVMGTVIPMVEKVRKGGAAAALDFGEKFDGIRPAAVRVPKAELKKAAEELDSSVRAAIEESIARVRAVHADQKPASHTTTLAPGATVTEVFQPIERVGLYVPGGKAVYPSSVIMNAVPAQEAGAAAMVVASPPQKEFGGLPHPTVLATCHMLGVDDVWAVGGGQAIGLLAYGDDEPVTGEEALEPVDIITGPGNVFVAAAKRAVQGAVGIDAEAGPTEIAILADETANPVYVAYDLISQAEHDPMAASVLITDSEDFAAAVNAEVAQRFTATANAERAAEALRGEQSGIVVVDDLEAGIAVADAYAAEHLEVHTKNARAVAERIRHAGAIFVGEYSPVPLGDYSAGSNHVLPTSGTARFSAGLSTHTFLRPVNLIEYDRAALGEVAQNVIAFATAEDLPAHGEAIAARFADDTDTQKEEA
ncbi:histidinol dehydrogenase [Corynebacterium aurimucosum]|uniref:Histidinol dehydrogenase n=1 Tax=Corynebacterium aurimucosum (strain ATCC 700975 / DSM 44827 / CIP 107346 / CN-1) TaxID=548476 RepID=C3PHB4_CORA7|nr:histidinol dehydrogenase [Corynebacterium aurimucosum]ACP33218.1 Histidinol dehydrogenase [Corynebacterium aurimucosum ATCC 700975]QQU92657.1 histidinol dehydrogenase [Corynebacterium aurimucosum]